MNKILNILGVTAIALTMTSCQDWLDMPSESSADSGSVFETVSRAELATVGAYASLHTQELGYQLLEGTDECASTESNSKYDVSNYNFTNVTGMLSNTYTSMYAAIEYANVCIQKLPGMSVSESEKGKVNALLGEALAVRAYAYWNLIRFYGDVPFTTVPTSELTTFASSRTDRDVIYDQCIADLQKAVELLPWQGEANAPSTTERFCKNSAYGILARVALYAAGYSLRWDLNTYDASTLHIARRDDAARVKELYQIAADACKAVIEKGQNGLLDNYDQLFRDLGNQTYNKETMLEYGWYGENAADVRTGYVNGIPTSGNDNSEGGMGKGGAQMMAYPTLFFDFDKDDQRRDVSVCNYGIVLSAKGNKYQMNTYNGMGVGKYRINWKKEMGATNSKRDINFPLLRYADVLLMYAEALNEVNNGPTQEAINAVKEVRKRAFRGNEIKAAAGIPTNHDDFLTFIQKERKLELSNEGLRRTDLTRWGKQYEMLMAAKQRLIDLAKRDGEFANVPVYRAYYLSTTPKFEDPTIALSYIDLSQAEVENLGLKADQISGLKVLNSSTAGKGSVTADLYEKDGKLYSEVNKPEGAVKHTYTILNMFSIVSIKQKGNLCVEDVTGVSSNNAWLTGNSGVFYGLQKNMTELMPFNTTKILDVNAGLEGQQHPAYK